MGEIEGIKQFLDFRGISSMEFKNENDIWIVGFEEHLEEMN